MEWQLTINELKGDLLSLFNKSFDGKTSICNECESEYPRHPIFYRKCKYGDGLEKVCKKCRGLEFISKNIHVIFKSYIKESEKICSDCKFIFPNTLDYFTKEQSKCKKCLGKEYGTQLGTINCQLINENKKKCKYCHTIKSNEEFKLHNKKKNIRVSYCNDCEDIYKTEKRRYDKEYYIENKKDKKEYYSNWKENGGNLIRQIHEQARITKKKSLLNDLTLKQWEFSLNYFNYSCAYCGLSKEEHKLLHNQSLHQDHIIPLSKDGVFSVFNIIPSCLTCNDSKNNMELEDFLKHSDKFTIGKYLKIIDYILEVI